MFLHLCSERRFENRSSSQSTAANAPEELSLLLLAALDCVEVSTLIGGVVDDVGALSLVDLACVDEFFERPGRDEAVTENVASLSQPIAPVDGLEVVARVPARLNEAGRHVSGRLAGGGSETTDVKDDDPVGSRCGRSRRKSANRAQRVWESDRNALRLRPTPPARVLMRKMKVSGSL